MANQSEDFKWFIKNQANLYAKYPNKYLLIKDKKVIETGTTFEEALAKASAAKIDLGTFIIQECGKDENCYTQSFSSRVVFA